jgi:hypothetical protein
MTLDDVYGPDEDRFPLEQEAEAEDWDAEDLGLDWEESEAQEICNEIASYRD